MLTAWWRSRTPENKQTRAARAASGKTSGQPLSSVPFLVFICACPCRAFWHFQTTLSPAMAPSCAISPGVLIVVLGLVPPLVAALDLVHAYSLGWHPFQAPCTSSRSRRRYQSCVRPGSSCCCCCQHLAGCASVCLASKQDASLRLSVIVVVLTPGSTCCPQHACPPLSSLFPLGKVSSLPLPLSPWAGPAV